MQFKWILKIIVLSINIMKVIDKYVKQNPAEKENKTLERFFDLLDVMDMEW